MRASMHTFVCSMQIVHKLKISFMDYSLLAPAGRGSCLQGAIFEEGATGKRRETASRFHVQAKTAESTSLACKTEAVSSCAVSVSKWATYCICTAVLHSTPNPAAVSRPRISRMPQTMARREVRTRYLALR